MSTKKALNISGARRDELTFKEKCQIVQSQEAEKYLKLKYNQFSNPNKDRTTLSFCRVMDSSKPYVYEAFDYSSINMNEADKHLNEPLIDLNLVFQDTLHIEESEERDIDLDTNIQTKEKTQKKTRRKQRRRRKKRR